MLRNEEKKKYEKNIVGKIINQYIAEDDWRLKNDFFGARGFPGGGSNIAIFIGARSGLEIIRLLEEIKSIKIIVVESNLALMTEIKNCLETYNSKKLTQTIEFYSKASELFESLNTSVIGIVRIDINSFHFQDVSYLIRNYQVDHIMGEFRLSDADPLEVFRLCKGNVGSFHWRIEGRSIPLCGSGKKSKVEVSVIVPCFKVLPWIDRCLETLANQTIKSFEIIAVNDGSPDDTGVRLDQWQQKFPDRIKVIHKKNGGCATARNEGLKASVGDFVAFVDADDWVDLNMFEDLYRAAILNAVEVSQCGYAEVFEDSGRIDQYPTAWGGTEDNGRSGIVFDVRSYLTVKPTIWRRIYSRNLLFSNDLFFAEKLRRFDDLPFQFEVLSRIKSMAIIPDCYYYYRQEREGQDISVRDRRLFVHFPIFDILKTRVMSWCDFDVEKNIIKSKINTHLWALSRIDAKLFFMYLGQASFDICKNNLRASRLDVFKLALNMNLKNIFAVIVLIGFSFFVKKKDVACD